ncbi:ATP phosphoribosyltransferase [candidate division KSB1 bacterium]|nr:ATP phosphoribosyltransferase [candidate division KSB1 bacterium]
MTKLKMVIPKGRICDNVVNLLNDAGFRMAIDERVYRPNISDPDIDVKLMKPQNIPKLVELGSHDIGFTGYDWIVETDAQVQELMDLRFNPVKIVAAVPHELVGKKLHQRKIVVASEYERLAKSFLDQNEYKYVFLRTYGATEVFPPDDADMIIDNSSSGRSLREQNLSVIATLFTSSTRFIANRQAMAESAKKEKIMQMKMLFQSVLDARDRVMLEMNIAKNKFETIVKILPCMQAPTVAPLHSGGGFAVKIAVKKDEVPKLIPRLKKLGATDILEYDIRKVVI